MRILVIFSNRLGDTIIGFPFLQSVKDHYPDCKLYVLTSHELKEFVSLVPIVDRVLTKVGVHKQSILNTFGTAKAIRKEGKFDICFCLGDSFSTALIAFISGIKVRVGHKADGRSFLLTHSYPYKDYKRHLTFKSAHLLENYLEKKIPPIPYTLNLSGSRYEASSDKKYMVVNVNSLGQTRILPVWKAVSMIEALQARFEYDIILIGAPAERDYVKEIFNGLQNKDGVFNYAGKTSLVELTYLLANGEIMISTDTGTAHMANVVGTPLVVFFGAGDYRKTRPHNTENLVVINKRLDCSPCKYKICKFGDPKCLTEIDNEEILTAVDSLLHKS